MPEIITDDRDPNANAHANTESEREDFVDAYIEAALWSSVDTDDEGNERNLDDGDFELSEEAREKLTSVARAFFDAHRSDFYTPNGEDARARGNRGPNVSVIAQAGHDAWLTQNGHGCGFWDGGWIEPNASKLDAAAKAMGSITLYIGDDDLIYAM